MLFVESLDFGLVVGHVVMTEFTRGIATTVFEFPVVI